MDAVEFGTDGWRATLDVFTTPRVRAVAQATADHLAEAGRGGEPVAVGYDARPTSREFAEAIADVLAANGHDVLLPERDCPTPLTAYAIVDRDLAGALVVTASHNPPEYNGVKFIPDDGAPALPHVTESIEANLRAPPADPDAARGEIREVDFAPAHFAHARELVDADLEGLDVVYDAMHGSGRGFTDALLESAGATVERHRCERSDDFGGTPPEPDEANLQALALAVQEHDADIGIANDGDADRIAIVTPERGFLDENLFFAATYDYLLEDDSGPAVRTVSTTFLIDRIADAHDEEVYETAVGFKWVAEEMGARDALFAGEESGGFSVRGHIREKDGVLMALLASAAAAEESYDDRVDRILETYGEVHQSKVSIACPDDRKAAVLDELADALPESVAGVAVERVNDADGFKALFADGSWLLVRASGTEPKMRVYAEADSESRVAELLEAGRDLVEPLV
ncbi:MAG: phosphoglucomutase/phosphomannomutase family protein [Halarchaeum sp.]